jgi:hypothetical protein
MATPEISSRCPSCGKENPPDSGICHFCGASATERIPLRIVTVGVALLLIIAAVHFYQASTYQPDYVAISALTPEMNFERVRVKGRVTNVQIIRGAYDHSQVRIEILDEGKPSPFASQNQISARLEGEPANDFLTKPDYVKRGDLVDVAASLYAGEGYRHLSVSSMQFIRVLEKGDGSIAYDSATGDPTFPRAAPAQQTTAGELLAHPEKFRDQLVSARPLEVVEVPEALPFFLASDAGKPESKLVVIGYKGAPLAVGAKISVRGKFVFYEKKSAWEIQVRDGDAGAVIVLPDGAEE